MAAAPVPAKPEEKEILDELVDIVKRLTAVKTKALETGSSDISRNLNTVIMLLESILASRGR